MRTYIKQWHLYTTLESGITRVRSHSPKKNGETRYSYKMRNAWYVPAQRRGLTPLHKNVRLPCSLVGQDIRLSPQATWVRVPAREMSFAFVVMGDVATLLLPGPLTECVLLACSQLFTVIKKSPTGARYCLYRDFFGVFIRSIFVFWGVRQSRVARQTHFSAMFAMFCGPAGWGRGGGGRPCSRVIWYEVDRATGFW